MPNPKTLFREQEPRDRFVERITIWQAVSIPEDLSPRGIEWLVRHLFGECGRTKRLGQGARAGSLEGRLGKSTRTVGTVLRGRLGLDPAVRSFGVLEKADAAMTPNLASPKAVQG